MRHTGTLLRVLQSVVDGCLQRRGVFVCAARSATAITAVWVLIVQIRSSTDTACLRTIFAEPSANVSEHMGIEKF